MDARLQQRVQRYGWDKAAAFYEGYWAEQLAPAQDQLMRDADLKPGEWVLDLACGTGLISLRAARAVGEEGNVTATDISEKMIEAVTLNAAREGLHNLRATRAMAEQLEFSDASFDVVLCSLGLMYVTDPRVTMREMHRVLRPGGRAVAAVWGARNRCGWAEIFPIVDKRVESEVCPLFFQLGNGEALATTLRQAGFTSVTSKRVETKLRYQSGADACGAAFAGGPVALAYSRFDEATRADACDEYLRSIEEWRSGDSYAIPGEFVIARGRRE